MTKPFISAFTIVRNAIQYDYPIVESIRSILPIVDEYIVAVGNSGDDTLKLIQSIQSPKIKIIETQWNDELREGGQVLAIETNKAKAAIHKDATWCFYLQGDEVVHEQDFPNILSACAAYEHDNRVEGLLFKYKHFYGSYDYVGISRRWYRNEIRIVRNQREILSYKDAQGFRKNGQKLKVKAVDAYIYHYGWVKDPRHQQAKQQSFHKMWHDDQWMKTHIAEADAFDYNNIDWLEKFDGKHPAVMHERLKRMNWEFHWDASQIKSSLKDKLLHHIEQWTGKRLFEYKNYEKL